MALTTALSSAGTSSAIYLDPVPKSTTAQVSLTSTSTQGALDLIVQVTLDDLATTASPTWTAVSTTHYSSTLTDGAMLTILSPVAGLRLSSTTWATGTATLKAIQSVTA